MQVLGAHRGGKRLMDKYRATGKRNAESMYFGCVDKLMHTGLSSQRPGHPHLIST